VLVGKPISHAGGLQTQLMPTLLVGGEAILAMKPTPAQAAALIERYSVTQYGLLASDLLDFIEYLEASGTRLTTLQNSIGSGDSVPVELHHRFRDLFGWEVLEGCGMTELGGYYAMNPRHGKRKWGSLGMPTPGTELRIVAPDGSDVKRGEIGEIALRSECTTTGYWQDPEATAELFRDGWLHSGDLAHYDDDGYVWFVGRKKLMIVRRGSNIAPAEIENVLDEHPRVHASVVVGVADNRDGHVPVAWIAPLHGTDAPTEEELKEYVSTRLAVYQSPVRYLFSQELPRNSTGKFDRHRLQELAEKTVRAPGQRSTAFAAQIQPNQ
jgi:acyl-CoA synthetase (AMP-forming)/AMP-acid ligase II